MAELDLTAAIDAAAKVLAYEAEEDSLDKSLPWEAATEDYKTIFRLSAREVLTVAAPLIRRAEREQVTKELFEFAETFGRDNAAQATLRRHIHMCARRIGPKMTDQQVVEALQCGDFVACHIDDAGRAIPPGETTEAGRG